MRTLRICSQHFAILAAVVYLSGAPALSQSTNNTSVRLLKLGVMDVGLKQHVLLERGSADLFGEIEGYQGKTLQALVQPSGQAQWIAGPWTTAEPGSYFTIPGITFPSRESRLVVAVFDHESPFKIGALVEEEDWLRRAATRSEIVTIQTTLEENARSQKISTTDALQPPIRIVSVGGANVGEGVVPVIRPSADVVVEAKSESRPYLYINVPGTNRCFVYGPGAADSEPNRFLFRNILFSFPGIPEQMHARLFVVIPKQSIQTGEVACGNSLDQSSPGSRTVEVVIGPKDKYVTDRVGSAVITGVGGQSTSAGGQLIVHDGDSVEARLIGVPEGFFPVVVARQKGTHSWMASSPMVEQVIPMTKDGPRTVEWISPTTRFVAQKPGELEGQELVEFEIMIVITNFVLPSTWLEGTFLSNQSIVEGVSKPLRVRVAEPAEVLKAELSISKVGAQHLRDGGPVEAPEGGSIEIETRGDRSQSFFVSVVIEEEGQPGVRLIGAVRNGSDFYAERWTGSDMSDSKRYTITAFSSLAPISFGSTDYAQLIPYMAHASAPRTIIVGQGLHAKDGFLASTERRLPVNLIWIVALGFSLVVIGLVIFQWLNGGVSDIARQAADRLAKGMNEAKERFEGPGKISAGRLFMGISVGTALIWAISQYYVWTYAEVIADVTGLERTEALNLGVYFLIALGILGVLLEQLRERPLAVRITLWTAILVLFSFQGLLYFGYFYRLGGPVAPLGFLAGICVPVVDALAMYYVSACLLEGDALGYLLVRCALAPFAILEIILRTVQHAFEGRRRSSEVGRAQDERHDGRHREEPQQTSQKTNSNGGRRDVKTPGNRRAKQEAGGAAPTERGNGDRDSHRPHVGGD